MEAVSNDSELVYVESVRTRRVQGDEQDFAGEDEGRQTQDCTDQAPDARGGAEEAAAGIAGAEASFAENVIVEDKWRRRKFLDF